MREKNRKPIANNRKRLPQFTTMNVIDGQAGLVNYSSLIFYSLTIDNILNIIVLLILAGVSIATLTGQNGILTQANTAKTQTEIGKEKEEISIAYSGAMAEKNGDGAVTANDLNTQFGLNGTEAIASGNNPITVSFDSGREYTIDSNGNISDPEESNIIARMRIEGEKVTTVPTLDGFSYKEGTIDTGYVVVDGEGNEFVWVPVDKNQKIKIDVTSEEEIESITLTDPYGDNILTESNPGKTYSKQDQEPTINGPYLLKVKTATEEKTVMLGVHSLYAVDTYADWLVTEEYAKIQGATLDQLLEGHTIEETYAMGGQFQKERYEETEDYTESVNNNGGFFIGRYEASNNNENMIVQKDKTSWNNISYTTALEKCTSKYTGKSYTCSLLTGAAWDRTLGWIYETGNKTEMQIVGDSKDWGNYYDDTFSGTTGVINTGSKEETKANNIYDLAGNLDEWSTEKFIEFDGQVSRGGKYSSSASDYPSYDRNNCDAPDSTSDDFGFRPAIYL